MDKKMTSGEIAKKAGVSLKAVRLYDEKGLLKPTDYSEGNYRLYDKEALIILEKIVALKQIGFSLEEIKSNLEAGEAQDIRSILEAQLKVMEEKRYQISKVIDMIQGTLERNEGDLDWDDIAYIVQSIDLDQKADERHWDALKHTGQELDWYVQIFRSLEFKEQEKVLDLGCGYAKLWRNNWKDIPRGTKIYGYDLHGTWADDFDEYVKEHAGELPEGVVIQVAFSDVEEADTWEEISKEKYDCIIGHYISGVLKDRDALFERVSQVLTEGGRFSFNGVCVSKWNDFFKEVLNGVGLSYDFVDEKAEMQAAKRDDMVARLQQQFSKVESVMLSNNWHYTEGKELYEKMLETYPDAKKYLSDHEEKITVYFAKQIEDKGELVIEVDSQFWHCYK